VTPAVTVGISALGESLLSAVGSAGPLWQHPEWLLPGAVASCLAILALGLGRWLARRRARTLLGDRAPAPARAGDALLIAALAALAVALAGPRLGTRELTVPSSGVDVVVLFDVSRSMQATDTPPSRLDRARRAAAGVLDRLAPGDRAALAAYGSHGVALTPLTHDTSALAEMLPAVDGDLLRDRGSDLEAGLAAALDAFGGDPGDAVPLRPRAVLLLSDGEIPGAEPPDAGAVARAGARIVAVGLGTETGAVLRDGGRVLRDASGRRVVSRREGESLRRLARATGGVYRPADRWGEVDVAALVGHLRREARAAPAASPPDEAADDEVLVRRVPAVRVAPFAALAFGLLALEALPRARRRAGRLRRAGAGPAALLVASALAAASPGAALAEAARSAAEGPGAGGGGAEPLPEPLAAAPAPEALEARLREHPGDARALVWLGLARAARGDRDEALRAFSAAATLARDPGLAALAYYDLGVAALEAGRLETARDAFLDAVALAPQDRRALFNLEWTLEALAERSAAKPPASGSGAPREPDGEGQGDPEHSGKGARPPGAAGPGAAGAGTPEPAPRREGSRPAGAGTAEEEPSPERHGAPAELAADDDPPPPEAAGSPGSSAAEGLLSEPLSPTEARRWLEAVRDDPARALRSAVRGASEGRSEEGPEW